MSPSLEANTDLGFMTRVPVSSLLQFHINENAVCSLIHIWLLQQRAMLLGYFHQPGFSQGTLQPPVKTVFNDCGASIECYPTRPYDCDSQVYISFKPFPPELQVCASLEALSLGELAQ